MIECSNSGCEDSDLSGGHVLEVSEGDLEYSLSRISGAKCSTAESEFSSVPTHKAVHKESHCLFTTLAWFDLPSSCARLQSLRRKLFCMKVGKLVTGLQIEVSHVLEIDVSECFISSKWTCLFMN